MVTAELNASDTGRTAGNFLATAATQRILDRTYVRKDQVSSPTLDLIIEGDSHASNWTPYATALGSMLARQATTEGISGQQSVDIVARQGGKPPLATVVGGLVPASGGVAVTILGGIRPLRSSGSLSRPAIFGGVAGTLSTTDGGVTYTFTRTAAGFAVPIPSTGSPLVLGTQHRDKFPILLAPRNDIGKDTASTVYRASIPEILDRYAAMAKWGAPNGRFLVLSMLPWSDEAPEGTAARLAVDAALRDQSPQQWLDWAAWLRTDAAFTAAGVTKTAQDTTDIANGITPTSFRVDNGHLNAAGYAAANPFVALAISSRGW